MGLSLVSSSSIQYSVTFRDGRSRSPSSLNSPPKLDSKGGEFGEGTLAVEDSFTDGTGGGGGVGGGRTEGILVSGGGAADSGGRGRRQRGGGSDVGGSGGRGGLPKWKSLKGKPAI